MRNRIYQLTRQRTLPNAGDRTLFFTSAGGGRRSPTKFFRPDEVPEFDGETAFIEVEKRPGGRRRIVRRVNADGTPYEA